jgi:hypothetical protein
MRISRQAGKSISGLRWLGGAGLADGWGILGDFVFAPTEPEERLRPALGLRG